MWPTTVSLGRGQLESFERIPALFSQAQSSVCSHLADARRLHGGRNAVDNRESRTSAPGRGRSRRIRACGRFETVPVVRDPDVASRVNGNVGDHLDATALENVDDVASLGAGGMPFGVVPGQQRRGTSPHVADPDVIIAVHVQPPRDAFRRASEALRRGLSAIGTDHIDRTCDSRRWSHDVLNHSLRDELELLHDGYAIGKLRDRLFQIHVACHPDIAFGVQRQGANTDSRAEALHLGGIVGWEPYYLVGRGVGDPYAILIVNDDVKGRLQPRDLDDAAVLDASARKQQQLVVRAVGNPNIPVRSDPDSHQAEELILEWKIAFRGDRMAVEIHDEDLSVEAADPDAVVRHGSTPADAVAAHAGQSGNRRRERGSVGAELAHTTTDALVNPRLRAGHPVHATPEIAVRVEHETANRV